MRHFKLWFCAFAFLASQASAAPAWVLTWADEFEGAANTAPDSKKWNYDLGGGGWGNNELQCYTKSLKNVRLDGKGNLVIEVRKEATRDAGGKTWNYSSGRLLTKGKFSQAYGKVEARMRLPGGQGIWPAFWMLGDDISTSPWPKCGEIDIMEHVGKEPGVVHATVHGPGYSGAGGIGHPTKVKSGEKLSDFHVYTLEWEPKEMRWYLDGQLYFKLGPQNLKGKTWVFDHPFFVILNLAVGGNWPGNPDASTPFPQQYVLDYVRAYKDPALKLDVAALKKLREANDEAARLAAAPPFKVQPAVSLPGRIEAENFGAYKDQDGENMGGEYRPNEGVDIQASSDSEGHKNIGWTKTGEWLEYAATSPGGKFIIKARVACEAEGGKLGFSWNGKALPVTIAVSGTGGWQSWTTLSTTAVEIPAGTGKLRMIMLSEGPQSQSAGNINYLDIVRAP